MTTMLRSQRLCAAAALLMLIVLLAAACGSGENLIDPDAPIAELRYEQLNRDLDGVVYRHISNLERFLAQADRPVLVAIWRADDPGLGRLIPYLEQLADQQRDRLRIVRVDLDQFPEICERLDFKATPAFALARDHAILKVWDDVVSPEQLNERLHGYLDVLPDLSRMATVK